MGKCFSEKILNDYKGKTIIAAVGQAGFIFKDLSENLIAIDLYISECVEREEGNIGFKRLLPHILNGEDIIFDFLIATHKHLDHFDYDAMPFLMRRNKTVLFASLDCEEYVKELEIDEKKVIYVRANNYFKENQVGFYFTPCDHGCSAPDAVGMVIELDDKVIYEVGDSCLHIDYALKIKERYKKIDVLIAPINGAYGNMDEKDCVELIKVINPDKVIPCHYGMFASHGGNPGLFYELMKREKMEDKVMFMQMGEIVEL